MARLLLSVLFVKFIHVSTYSCSPFTFIVVQYSTLWIQHYLHIYSTANRYFGCFQCWAIMHNDPMKQYFGLHNRRKTNLLLSLQIAAKWKKNVDNWDKIP